MGRSQDASIEVSPNALAEAWRAVGRQLAVVGGSGVALVSLLQDTPVRIASLRGAITWASVLAITSLGAWLAMRTWRAPDVDPENEADDGVESVQ